MTRITKTVSLPLDSTGFLRRECPYCKREFKIKNEDYATIQESDELFCPYCGQTASRDSWFTTSQCDLIQKVAENTAISLINQELIPALKRLNAPSKGITVKIIELDPKNELINPETDDMDLFSLPCCSTEIKIDDNFNNPIFCYYCGFGHKR